MRGEQTRDRQSQMVHSLISVIPDKETPYYFEKKCNQQTRLWHMLLDCVAVFETSRCESKA